MKHLFLALSCCLLMLLCRCNTPMAGGGTETTNGITCLIPPDESPAGHGMTEMLAAVYSVDYRPDSSIGFAETTVVSPGVTFTFDSLPPGKYNLLVQSANRGNSVFIPSLPPDTALPAVQLKPSGDITVRTENVATPQWCTILIPGTPFYSVGETPDDITIRSVPEGTFTMLIHQTPKGTDVVSPIDDHPDSVSISTVPLDTVIYSLP